MTARVAALWRAQGDTFLDEHHAGVIDDVARLRAALVVAPSLPNTEHERLMDRLRRLDQATVERIAAVRGNAVIDLTGPEPEVRITNDEDGPRHEADRECRRCHGHFAEDMLVRTGERVRPLCMNCALVVAGVRRSR